MNDDADEPVDRSDPPNVIPVQPPMVTALRDMAALGKQVGATADTFRALQQMAKADTARLAGLEALRRNIARPIRTPDYVRLPPPPTHAQVAELTELIADMADEQARNREARIAAEKKARRWKVGAYFGSFVASPLATLFINWLVNR